MLRTPNRNGNQFVSNFGSESESATTPSPRAPPFAPPRYVPKSWFVRFSATLNHIGCLVHLLVACTVLIVAAHAPETRRRNAVYSLLAIYQCLFALTSFVAEWFESDRVFALFPFLRLWITRGLFYVFQALLMAATSSSDVGLGTMPGRSASMSSRAARIDLLDTVATYAAFAYGSVYVVLGALCLQRFKTRATLLEKKREGYLDEASRLESKKKRVEMLIQETESSLQKL